MNTRRNCLFGFLFGVGTIKAAPAPQSIDMLCQEWNKFSTLMNDYITGLNNNVNDVVTLRRGVKAWKAMERSEGWDKL